MSNQIHDSLNNVLKAVGASVDLPSEVNMNCQKLVLGNRKYIKYHITIIFQEKRDTNDSLTSQYSVVTNIHLILFQKRCFAAAGSRTTPATPTKDNIQGSHSVALVIRTDATAPPVVNFGCPF